MSHPIVAVGVTFLLALGISSYLTPIIRRGALRFGVLDTPDGALKNHAEPVPYLGGVAVYLGFIIALSIVFELDAQLLGLLLGGTMVAMVGLFDDLRVLTPGLKLLGQLIAVWVTLRSGIVIELIRLPPELAIALSVLWLIAITNATNILDVSDGLASSVGAVAAAGIGTIALIGGNVPLCLAAVALCGSLLGFLRYNRAPARIYLGDTGSLFVGFTLAGLSLLTAYTLENEVAALAPVALLVVPIVETTLVTLARLGRGRSPMRGSDDHLALRLKRRGWSSPAIAWGAAGAGAVGAGAGVAMVLGNATIAAGCAAGVGILSLSALAWLWTR